MITVKNASDEAVAAARGAAYGLIAAGFRYPDRALLDQFAASQHWAEWPAVLRELDGKAGEALQRLRERLPEARSEADNAPNDELLTAFVHLFSHTVRGKCPPYELEYGQSEIIQRASDLADIGGFYVAFGLRIADEYDDRVDHVSVECEYMSVLCRKEAHALSVDDAVMLEVCRAAQRRFLKDHLGQWLPAFAHRVCKADADGFYAMMAGFADAFIDGECSRLDVTKGPQLLSVREADVEEETNIECGVPDLGGASASRFTPLTVESNEVQGSG